jgi:peptidoglycan L-alanyl-D-glutamate endopeptidase CwlK
MEYTLSNLSRSRLEGVDNKLKTLVDLAIYRTPVDFGIAWMGGKRTAEEQNRLFKKGVSKKDGYNKKSKHQGGKAVDILPYLNGKPVIGKQAKKYYLIIIGVMFSCASELQIKIRCGANWDMDQEFLSDQSFDDLPHIELI